MNYYSLLITFGVLVVLIPNLGFPGGWKVVMLSALGCAVSIVAYLASREVAEVSDDMPTKESVLPE